MAWIHARAYLFIGPGEKRYTVNVMPRSTGEADDTVLVVPPVPGVEPSEIMLQGTGLRVRSDRDHLRYPLSPFSNIHQAYTDTRYATRSGAVEATRFVVSGLEADADPYDAALAVTELALRSMGLTPRIAARQAQGIAFLGTIK